MAAWMASEMAGEREVDVDALEVAAELDALGLKCPLPVLKARRRLKPLASGSILRIVSDDPVAVIDVPNLCREDGHELVATAALEGATAFYVRKR